MQALKHCDLALTKLKLLTKDRPLEDISAALAIKHDALNFTGQDKEALECTKEWYSLWAMARGPAHPKTIAAAFSLIQSLVHNGEWEQAELLARTLWEILNSSTHHFEDDRIPDDLRQQYLARGAKEYARAIYRLAEAGGIPPEHKQKRGEDAIALARRSIEIYIQTNGTESHDISCAMNTLARVLDYFNDVDDDEVIRLIEDSNAISSRLCGSVSLNVALGENNLASAYNNRAIRAETANDLKRRLANLELALPHCREAARIYRALNIMDKADESEQRVVKLEESLRRLRIDRALSRKSS